MSQQKCTARQKLTNLVVQITLNKTKTPPNNRPNWALYLQSSQISRYLKPLCEWLHN